MLDTQTEIQQLLEERTQRIKKHLATIDPVFIPFAEKLTKPPYKDLTYAEELSKRGEGLEASDLVAIHLTDTFPDHGIIHPMIHYDSKILRHSLHFTANAIADPAEFYGTVWQWNNKKYAVLIPFEKLIPRVEEFNPGDTLVLDDLILPEGSVVIKDKNDRLENDLGKAKLVDADYSQAGQRLNGFQRSAYDQMIQMGYFPQRATTAGWFGDWGINTWMYQEFCKRNNLRYGVGHAHHWSWRIENFSLYLEKLAQEKDETAFQDAVEEAQRDYLGKEGDLIGIPKKYQLEVSNLLQQYHKEVFPNVDVSNSRLSVAA